MSDDETTGPIDPETIEEALVDEIEDENLMTESDESL